MQKNDASHNAIMSPSDVIGNNQIFAAYFGRKQQYKTTYLGQTRKS